MEGLMMDDERQKDTQMDVTSYVGELQKIDEALQTDLAITIREMEGVYKDYMDITEGKKILLEGFQSQMGKWQQFLLNIPCIYDKDNFRETVEGLYSQVRKLGYNFDEEEL